MLLTHSQAPQIYLIDVFIVNFEQISHYVLVFPQLTLNKQILAGILKDETLGHRMKLRMLEIAQNDFKPSRMHRNGFLDPQSAILSICLSVCLLVRSFSLEPLVEISDFLREVRMSSNLKVKGLDFLKKFLFWDVQAHRA